MEYLLTELKRRGVRESSLDDVYRFVCGGFAKLHRHYDWGRNLFYYLAGQCNVHPSYVQDMIGDEGLDSSDILSVIELLGSTGGLAYKPSGVANAIASRFTEQEGSWDAAEWSGRKTALVVAGGPQARAHAAELTSWVEATQPLLVALNYVDFLPPSLVTAYAACHPARIFSIAERIAATGRPLVAPRAALPAGLLQRLDGVPILDYGMRVEHGNFVAEGKGAVVSSPLVASYVLALLAAAGVERIVLAGFDGYDGTSEKYAEMVQQFELFQQAHPSVELSSATASRYPIAQRSLYAPGSESR